MMKERQVGSEHSKTVDLYNLKTEQDYKSAYEVFNHAMESSFKYELTKKYVAYMAKHFDAMVDDNNQGIYNRAKDPIIIMNTKKLLASQGLARQLSVQEILDNCEYIGKELEKHGERIKL